MKDLLTESGLENEGLITDIIGTEQKMRQIDTGRKKRHSHLFINFFPDTVVLSVITIDATRNQL